jgi:hypothetical protein
MRSLRPAATTMPYAGPSIIRAPSYGNGVPPAVPYTHKMDEGPVRAEQLLTLSSAARRLAELMSAAEQPAHYEVLRHLLRVSEETMIEVLDEAVHVRLVRRGADPFTYVPHDESVGAEIRESMPPDRLARLRAQLASAAERVFE